MDKEKKEAMKKLVEFIYSETDGTMDYPHSNGIVQTLMIMMYEEREDIF